MGNNEHLSGSSLREQYAAFLDECPDYSSTLPLDTIRATEFSRLDRLGHVYLDYTGGGLTTRDGKTPSHFSIAGEDQKFHPATAAIDGNEVVVSADNVASPKAVRFGFDNLSVPNLTNREGLPAPSFRTDSL